MNIPKHKTPTVFDKYDIVTTADVSHAMHRLELNGNGESLVKTSRSGSRRNRLKH